jgi:hypothetical protein
MRRLYLGIPHRQVATAVHLDDLGLRDLLRVLHARLDPRLYRRAVRDDGRRHHGPEEVSLAALV